MGGSALLIYGTVTERRSEPKPISRSLIDRVLQRSSGAVPQWRQIGPNRRMMNLPSDDLELMGRQFRDYLTTQFPNPWPATEAVLKYLDLGVTNVYVRGDQEGDAPPEWYVQLTFSGCGGMAEITSELATHWADKWFQTESERLTSSLLRPYGFEPGGRTISVAESVIFAPIGGVGYASFSAAPRDVEEEFPESRYFEVDAAATEVFDETERAEAVRKLDGELRPLIPTESCCCQWCAPALDIAALDDAIPLKWKA